MALCESIRAERLDLDGNPVLSSNDTGSTSKEWLKGMLDTKTRSRQSTLTIWNFLKSSLDCQILSGSSTSLLGQSQVIEQWTLLKENFNRGKKLLKFNIQFVEDDGEKIDSSPLWLNGDAFRHFFKTRTKLLEQLEIWSAAL